MMDAQDSFLTLPIAKMASELIAHIAPDPADMQVKVAALRAAADILGQAISAATLAAIIRQQLTPKG